jgi:16S rRNA (uracil1498-N3)-methyltransferase
MDRFFVKQENLRGKEVVLEGQPAHQINTVLRKKAGEHIIVLDNLGAEYEIELQTIEKKKVTGQIKGKREAAGEPMVEITLYQSLLSREKFEWVLQKCTEVGVVRFVPVITERSLVRSPDAVKTDKIERWRRIITEAAEQSRRGRIPELALPVKFGQFMATLEGFDCLLMPLAKAEGVSLQEALSSGGKDKPSTIALFIGPEGGFTEKEIELGRARGAVAVGLGRRILRTETAAVVAASLILYESGEMYG